MARSKKLKSSPLKPFSKQQKDFTPSPNKKNKKHKHSPRKLRQTKTIEPTSKTIENGNEAQKNALSIVKVSKHIFFDEENNTINNLNKTTIAKKKLMDETDDERISEAEETDDTVDGEVIDTEILAEVVVENNKENEENDCTTTKQLMKNSDKNKNVHEQDTIIPEGDEDVVHTERPKHIGNEFYTDEMYQSDRNEMFKNLNTNEIRLLRVYVRGPVFRKIKFVSADKTGRDSPIINRMFEAINVLDKEKQSIKFHGVRHILQRQLNSKRNYTVEKVTKAAVELIRNNMMFNVEDTSKFYDKDSPKHIRRIWYIFAYRFLTCVNSDWLKAVSSSKVKSQSHMFRYISVSDEAYVRWLLEVKRNKFMSIARQQEASFPKDSKTFQKPKGFHDSNKFSSRYIEIHKQVRDGRTQENKDLWNGFFWAYFKRQNAILFQDNSNITREATSSAFKNSLPDEDDDVPVSAISETKEVELDDDEFEDWDPEKTLDSYGISTSTIRNVRNVEQPIMTLVTSSYRSSSPIISDVPPVDV